MKQFRTIEWAWKQCIAIDASVAGTIIRTFRDHAEGEKVKIWLDRLLPMLLASLQER